MEVETAMGAKVEVLEEEAAMEVEVSLRIDQFTFHHRWEEEGTDRTCTSPVAMGGSPIKSNEESPCSMNRGIGGLARRTKAEILDKITNKEVRNHLSKPRHQVHPSPGNTKTSSRTVNTW